LQTQFHGNRFCFETGVEVASCDRVAEPNIPTVDRRMPGADRRRHSRSGRRASDPHTNWRRIAWLFAAYALYLSVRSLPETVRNLFSRTAKA
jgi:hypothetical protein